jgi:hypothetical protein
MSPTSYQLLHPALFGNTKVGINSEPPKHTRNYFCFFRYFPENKGYLFQTDQQPSPKS